MRHEWTDPQSGRRYTLEDGKVIFGESGDALPILLDVAKELQRLVQASAFSRAVAQGLAQSLNILDAENRMLRAAIEHPDTVLNPEWVTALKAELIALRSRNFRLAERVSALERRLLKYKGRRRRHKAERDELRAKIRALEKALADPT